MKTLRLPPLPVLFLALCLWLAGAGQSHAQVPAVVRNGYRNAFVINPPAPVSPVGEAAPPNGHVLLPAYQVQGKNGTAYGGFVINGYGTLSPNTTDPGSGTFDPAAVSFPESTITTNVPQKVQLRSAIIGRPLVVFNISYNFGQVIQPPEKLDGSGQPIAGFYREEPLNSRLRTTVVVNNGVETRMVENATSSDVDGRTVNTAGNIVTTITIGLNPDFYWSKHARKVYATQPGTILIRWRETDSTATNEKTYVIATSPDKPERTLYWTENGFNGPVVEVPAGRANAVNFIFNSLVAEQVSEPYDPWQAGLVDFTETDPAKQRYKTVYYDNNLIHAYNVEGRVFVEYLGNPRADGTNEPKGYEIVNIVKEAVPGTVMVDLGEKVGHLPATGDDGKPASLEAKIIAGQGLGGDPYLYVHVALGQRTLFAIRNTLPGVLSEGQFQQTSNEVLIYWRESAVLDLLWPKQYIGYVFQWPVTTDKYSIYARPDASAPASVKSVAVSAGGNGYTSPPTVTFSGGNTGSNKAAGIAVLSNGAVTEVIVTNAGSRYTTAPGVSFSGGGGSGATATATIAGGQEAALATAVQLDPTNNPALIYQDDPTNAQAVLAPGNLFYTRVTSADPTNRALLRFTKDDDIWFERVYSQVDPYHLNPVPYLERTVTVAGDKVGAFATGFSNISNVSVKNPTTGATLVEGVDYTVNPATGVVTLIEKKYITSVASLGNRNAGDTVAVRLYAGYSVFWNYRDYSSGPHWEARSLSLTSTGASDPFASFDFRTGGGSISVQNSGYVTPWSYVPNSGIWRTSGWANNLTGSSSLVTPTFTVTQPGPVTVKLAHRYNFALAGGSLPLEGGLIQSSVNGGAWQTVPISSFSENGYYGSALVYNAPPDTDVLTQNQFAFSRKSAGYDLPANNITSVAITFSASTLPYSTIPLTVDADIGQRIEPPGTTAASTYGNAAPVYVGYIDQTIGTAFNVQAYKDPFVVGFDEAAQGAIIGVNAVAGKDKLEIWWYKKSTPAGAIAGTYWPSFVQQYKLHWPAASHPAGPEKDQIILASNQGSDDLPSLQATGSIYFQNNPNLPGYNPNEEHALMLNGRAWALRDDLNVPASSDPWVLVHYVESDQRPAMRVFQVLRATGTWPFSYNAIAGKVLQAPMPLPLLPPPLLPDRSLASYQIPGANPENNVSSALGSTDAGFAHYQQFIWTDRKGIPWVYRGPHQGNGVSPAPTLKMRYFYNTLAGFYFPGLPFNQQPAIGTITPYLRAGTPGNYTGNEVNGVTGSGKETERGTQPLDIIFTPRWPDSAPELRVGETLTLSKLGLPAVRGQASAELLYQQSIARDPSPIMAQRQKSARLFDPTRAKVYPLSPATLPTIPDSVNTSVYLGKTYFPNLPPHLSGRLYFDPAVGAHGSLIFKGLFMNEPVGEKYLQLNVLSAADLTAAKRLTATEDINKTKWDTAINGLTTTMETFIEDPSRKGTFIVLDQETGTFHRPFPIIAGKEAPIPATAGPLVATKGSSARPAVKPDEAAEIFYSDTAVDSYAVSASGGGQGYVVLAAGNGMDSDLTPAGQPVSLQVFKVNAPLYRGELKVINSQNPLDEKLTLQHTGDFAGHPEEYDFEWRYAPPVDGLPAKLYSFVRKEISGDSSDWSFIANPVGNTLDSTEDYTRFRSPTASVSGYPVFSLPGSPIIINNGKGSAANGTTLPHALLRRTFSAPSRPLRLFLSLNLRSNDGAVVYLNNAAVAAWNAPGLANTPLSTVPTTAPAFLPLTKIFEIDPNTLAASATANNNVFTVELHTSADAGSTTTFNLRLEGLQEVENLAGWLPLTDLGDVNRPGDTVITTYPGISAVNGKNRHTIQGTSILTLSDNWIIMRYRAKDSSNAAFASGWSKWTEPQLAEGWIKRVLAGINPFQQRVKDLFNHETNTSVSLVEQAGKRWEGDVALNLDNINDSGLIEIYETVLNRGKDLSITGTPAINYGGANDALLLAAGYLSDLYMILGNEAYADAANSTIAFNTNGQAAQYGDVATALFSFKGQLATVLDEELSLMRGRDDSLLPNTTKSPIYNRLIWNYTRGIDSGEAIYALNYNIKDRTWDDSINPNNPSNLPADGIISAADAAISYPQGHGDAYGHYLTALTGYYSLLNNPNFTWTPRIEAVLVLGTPVSVDYQDERKFAAAAAAVARSASRTLDLTYRKEFTAAEDTGWKQQHDQTTNANTGRTRHWGTDDWACRGGQGALFHWVTANSLLPAVDPNPNHAGIQKIDRTTVPELAEIVAQAQAIQQTLDNADAHLNPLGLAAGALTFDISPSDVDAGKTHYEQIYERATAALQNAVSAFNNAKGSTQFLRQQEDTLDDQRYAIESQEQAFTNQLIELYGTPYTDDIGPGKTYKQDYAGPDLLHSLYVDLPEIFSTGLAQTTYSLLLDPKFASDNSDALIPGESVSYTLNANGIAATPGSWTGRRASPGRMQTVLSDIFLARQSLKTALESYSSLHSTISTEISRYGSAVAASKAQNAKNIAQASTLEALSLTRTAAKIAFRFTDEVSKLADRAEEAAIDVLPLSLGLSSDPSFALRGGIRLARAQAAVIEGPALFTSENVIDGVDAAIEALNFGFAIDAQQLTFQQENKQLLYNLQATLDSLKEGAAVVDAGLRRFDQAQRDVYALQAEGNRIQQQRLVFRQHAAAIIQGYRTRDFAFRAFRDEALERYNALFDLAARYTYLAAGAYDYETGLLDAGGNAKATTFYNKIVQARALGVISNGVPQFAGASTGDPGLSGVLAAMAGDWSVAKTRLGFNNPDRYRTTFSLRQENSRIIPGTEGDRTWKDLLSASKLDNILTDPDVRRHAMRANNPGAFAVPGLVIEFSTTIADGYNFFGKPLASGDHGFSPASFATKIRSSGVAFKGYVGMDDPTSLGGALGGIGAVSPDDPNLGFNDPNGLSATPYIYLIPAGVDSMRSPPLGDTDTLRTWSVTDQAIPLPFNIADSDYSTQPAWVTAASLSEPAFMLRKHQAFRAVPDGTVFSSAPGFTNSRLIGRSVWNSRWKIVIPGNTLLNNPKEGLRIFLDTVKDIKLHLETYSYSGN